MFSDRLSLQVLLPPASGEVLANTSLTSEAVRAAAGEFSNTLEASFRRLQERQSAAEQLWPESLGERLCSRLRRVREQGASAVLEDDDNEDSGGEKQACGPKNETLAIVHEAFEMKAELEKLVASLNNLTKRADWIMSEASSAMEASQLVEGQAYVPHLAILRITDRCLLKHWSKDSTILPEYQQAAKLICLPREWMCSTLLGKHINEVADRYDADLQRYKRDTSSVHSVLEQAVQKAYGLPNRLAASLQRDLLSNQPVLLRVYEVYQELDLWKRPFFAVAWQVLVDMEDDTAALMSTLSEVVDHSLHCSQVRVKAFQVVLTHSARLLNQRQNSTAQATGGLEDFDAALLRFYACFEDFLDDHKERAFSAAFLEPCRFYWSHSDQGEDKVDNTYMHAVNWYLAVLNSALSIHLPLAANYSDVNSVGVADFWAALQDECWEHFSKPEHFGSGWQGIAALKRGGKSLLRQRVRPGHLPSHKESGCEVPAKLFANVAVDPEGDVGVRRVMSLYLERFAYFFSRGFFVQKAFEALNSEVKPDHHGFRKACETLFQRYRREHDEVVEESLLEHVYCEDPYFRKLDVERTASFFTWLKVVNMPSAGKAEGDAAALSSLQARFLYNDMDEELEKLRQMEGEIWADGFREEEARNALLACHGNFDSAIGVLLGNGPPPHGMPKGQEPLVPSWPEVPGVLPSMF